ncbi:hypothetical protein BJ508DRAFT_326609 [Ascobolus immersus RN42]|uniref:Uncharacterized protein n=1 Tax=Ascobolus immersus RN42 TaxID=1160509 RepID=A0A3N4I557_ASCIM|nr:hypothetical protein BJ508DRAFT_326609 [Ascobolus immersus RN42]
MSCIQSLLDNDLDVALLDDDESMQQVEYMDREPRSETLIDFESGSSPLYNLSDEFDEEMANMGNSSSDSSLPVSPTIIKDLSGLDFDLSPGMKAPVIKSSPPMYKSTLAAKSTPMTSYPLGLSMVKRKKRDLPESMSSDSDCIPLDQHPVIRQYKRDRILLEFEDERSYSSGSYANKVDHDPDSSSSTSDSHPRRKKANTNIFRPPALVRSSDVGIMKRPIRAPAGRYSRDFRDYEIDQAPKKPRQHVGGGFSLPKSESEEFDLRANTNHGRGRQSASVSRSLHPNQERSLSDRITYPSQTVPLSSRITRPSHTDSLGPPPTISSPFPLPTMSRGIASDKSVVEVINTRPYKSADTSANREFLISVGRCPAPPLSQIPPGKKKDATGRVLGGPSLFKKTKDGKPVWMSAYGLERERECMEALAQKDPEIMKVLESIKEKELAALKEVEMEAGVDGGRRDEARVVVPGGSGKVWGFGYKPEEKFGYRSKGDMVVKARRLLKSGQMQSEGLSGRITGSRSRKGERRSEKYGLVDELDY